ncbi:MAG TPA: uroporphyrinogen decarboxylase family protein [Candidatus Atribacteria bacterium]|nr:uroporphyrinogen decarboxylase family protein [Candidatus Atribacteria bacterium]
MFLTPKPDKEEFREIILREKVSYPVHLIELHIDTEVIKYFTEKWGRKWVEPSLAKDRESQEEVLKNYIECWYRLGYDYVRLTSDFRFSAGLSFASSKREGEDTALLSRGKRHWVEEGKGVISSWEDFDNYHWPSPEEMGLWPLEFVSQNLPEGMGMLVVFSPGVFEVLSNELFGLETLSYLLYDDPNLVEAVANKVGELIYRAYERVVGLDNLLGFFQGDDMGFKRGTLVSPEALRKYILPWHKKFAQLAHDHGLLYLLHNCGYCEPIMEDLIEEVKIDGKHSFEDEIMPVTEFKEKYGDRIAVLGGVDVDKLCRLNEEQLRSYVRDILEKCMPGGRYLLGSGNSITNYMPPENYLIMLDEGAKYGKG